MLKPGCMVAVMNWVGSFRRVWTAAALSNLGDGLLVVALPLLIIDHTRNPLLVAGIAAAAQAPYLLVSLFAGVLADRQDRRRLLLMMNALAAVVLLAAALVSTADGSVAVIALYCTACVVGACQTVSNTTAPALLPTIVPRTRLEWANSRIFGTQSTLQEFGAPLLAGLLVTAGVSLAFSTIAAAYVGVVLVLWGLRGSFRPEQRANRVLADIRDGIRFVWRHRVLRTLSLMVAVMAGCWAAWESVLVLYVVSPGPVGLSGFGYGALITTLAVGGVAGALAAEPMRRLIGRRYVLLADLFAAAIMIGTPALTANRYVLGAAIFIGGFGSGMWNVASSSLRQALTPNHLRGRVSATGLLLGWGPLPVGALIGGVVAYAFSPQIVFAGGALFIAALVVPAARALTTEAVTIAETAADDAATKTSTDEESQTPAESSGGQHGPVQAATDD